MSQFHAFILGFILILSSPAIEAEPKGNRFDTKFGAPTLRPECGTMANFGNAMGELALDIYKGLAAIGSTIVPHLGYRLEKEAGAVIISWPLQWAFGTVVGENNNPKSKCRIKGSSPEQFKAHRLVLEPQILAYTHPDVSNTYFGLRPAYRFVYHDENSKLGYGIGVGGQFIFEGDSGTRSALSSEIILQYGDCCIPGFWDLAVRYDYEFSEETHGISFIFGWSYF